MHGQCDEAHISTSAQVARSTSGKFPYGSVKVPHGAAVRVTMPLCEDLVAQVNPSE